MHLDSTRTERLSESIITNRDPGVWLRWLEEIREDTEQGTAKRF